MEYIVQPGDTIYEIAKRFGYSVDQVIALNPDLEDPNLIYPGQVINLPEGRPEQRAWCALILYPKHEVACEPGVCLARTGEDGKLVVMVRGLPEPKKIDARLSRYMVWVLSSRDPVIVKYCYLLQAAYFAGIWFCAKEGISLSREDYIQVSAEPMEQDNVPSGPVICANSMKMCCPDN